MPTRETRDQLMNLFQGFPDAYGTYRIDHQSDAGKQVGKGLTVRAPVTPELWDLHLDGKQSLGIIPILADGTAWWGCIDVDQYSVDHLGLVKKIAELALPLVVCRSKSGGAHLFVFLSSPASAELVQAKLRRFAAALGYGRSEIFPKQTSVLVERGDLGNWLNMPYFAAVTTRYGFRADGAAATLEEFVEIALQSRLCPEALAKTVPAKEPTASGFDGPPCLQHLMEHGFPEGTRNNGLYNVAVYLKSAFPDDWQHRLEQANTEHFQPPLPPAEVRDVAKRIDRKDYRYRCSDQPIASYCNAYACRLRKYGVGPGSQHLIVGISKLLTEPAIWFVDVEGGGRLELTTDQLSSPALFRKACMEAFSLVPQVGGQKAWDRQLDGLMSQVIEIEAPPDSSRSGMFYDLLEDFCSRPPAKTVGELRIGKQMLEDGQVFFRLHALQTFLDREARREFGRNTITNLLRKLGGENVVKWAPASKAGGRGMPIRVWSIPQFAQHEPLVDESELETKPPF